MAWKCCITENGDDNYTVLDSSCVTLGTTLLASQPP